MKKISTVAAKQSKKFRELTRVPDLQYFCEAGAEPCAVRSCRYGCCERAKVYAL
jgi:hypothetical protein